MSVFLSRVVNTFKRIVYFIRWRHWPKRMRRPQGVVWSTTPWVIPEDPFGDGSTTQPFIALDWGEANDRFDPYDDPDLF